MAVTRTCCRCGGVFESEGKPRHTLCPVCRTPILIAALLTEPVLLGMPLSPREVSICRLIALGKPNKEIGAALYLTEGTVKQYTGRIFQKLGCKNRTEVAIRTIQDAAAKV
jgi:DNA-binding NarL/FixJ family response regulator